MSEIALWAIKITPLNILKKVTSVFVDHLSAVIGFSLESYHFLNYIQVLSLSLLHLTSRQVGRMGHLNTGRVLVGLSKALPSPKLVLLPRACVKPPCAASHVLSVLFQTSTQDLGTVRFNKPLLGSNQAAERFSCGCHHPMESGSSAAESWATVAGGPWSDS